MKPEIIVKNWLMSWFKPEVETAYNKPTPDRPPLTRENFGEFISFFVNEREEQEFSEEEKETLEDIIVPLDGEFKFASGYPTNDKETIQTGAIYLIPAGWQQSHKYIGDNKWYGKGATQIAVTGTTVGKDLNMAEPSLLLQVITSLLMAGQGFFTSQHIKDQNIQETLFAEDARNSFDREYAIRTVTMTYDMERHGVITTRVIPPKLPSERIA
jgi:hypothetical protein